MAGSKRGRVNGGYSWAQHFVPGLVFSCLLGAQLTTEAYAQRDLATRSPVASAGAVHSMRLSQAERGVPVRFRAMVMFYDPSEAETGATNASLFVLDKTGGVWVGMPARPVLPLHEGTLVEVSGVTRQGDFAPSVWPGRVKVLGKSGPLPNPLHVGFTTLATGAYDCLFVEVEGVIHSVSRFGHLMSLRVATRDGSLYALTPARPGVDYSRLIDAQVRLRGVAAADYNNHQQMTGVHLFFQTLQDVTVVRAARGDPFALPVRTIDRLARFDAHATAYDRMHVRGQVTLQWPGHMLCVEDTTAGLCLPRTDPELYPAGSVLDVVGYPVLAAEVPALNDAMVRRLGAEARPPNPDAATSFSVRQGDVAGRLVTLDGMLAGVGNDDRQWLLTILSDGMAFTAVLPRSAVPPGGPPDWHVGTLVRVTGVCVSEADKQIVQDWSSLQRLTSFHLLMRSPADLAVLRKATWWTPDHMVSALGMVAMAMFAVFSWVVLLRRQVRQRTQQLRENERRFRHLAHHDALTGVANRLLFHERAESALELSRRRGGFVGVLLLDLDHFKPVNDTLGHDAGDSMLRALAERVTGAVRKVDTVARLGGDEFAVVLGDVAEGGVAECVAQKILSAVCQPVEIAGRPIGMSASIGVAVFPEDGTSVTELLRSADLAMYESKKHLRGGVRRYRREVTLAEIEQLTSFTAAQLLPGNV